MSTTGMIKYRSGYKYQLTEDYVTRLPHTPPRDIETKFIRFLTTGELLVR